MKKAGFFLTGGSPVCYRRLASGTSSGKPADNKSCGGFLWTLKEYVCWARDSWATELRRYAQRGIRRDAAGYRAAVHRQRHEHDRKNLNRDVEKGKISKEQMDAVLGRIRPTLDLKEAGRRRGVVVEVVIELMDLKKKCTRSWKPSYRLTACFSPTPRV
jgi:hypothetical protein